MGKTRYVIYEYVASDGTRKKARVAEEAFKAYEAKSGAGSLRVVGTEVEGEGLLPGQADAKRDRDVRSNAASIEDIAYEKDGQSRNILRKDVGTEGKALEQQGWKRKYSPLGSLLKGAASGVANLVPGSGGLPGIAKFVNPGDGVFAGAEVAENLENSQRENPLEFGIGETGAPAALPIPGGKLASTGSKALAALRMGAIGTTAGAVTASNKAPEGQRLEGFVEGAKTTAPFAFGGSALLSPFLRKPGAVKVEPKGSGASLLGPSAPKFGWWKPQTWLHPQSLMDSGADARFRSLRASPTQGELLADSFGGKTQAGIAINTQKVPEYVPGMRRGAVGNALESVRQKLPWTKSVLGTGEMPLLPAHAEADDAAAIFDAVKEPAGTAIRAIEESAPKVNVQPVLDSLRSGPLAKLRASYETEGPGPAKAFSAVLDRVQQTRAPLLNLKGTRTTLTPGTKNQIVSRPTGLTEYRLGEPVPAKEYFPGSVGDDGMRSNPVPGSFARPVEESGERFFPGATEYPPKPVWRPGEPDRVAPSPPTPKLYSSPEYGFGEPVPAMDAPIIDAFTRPAVPVGPQMRNVYEEVPSLVRAGPPAPTERSVKPSVALAPPSELTDIASSMRAGARRRGGQYQGVTPKNAALGDAMADSVNTVSRARDEHLASVLEPDTKSQLDDLRGLYRIAARGDESTNAYRSAVAASRSLGSEIQRGAWGQIGAALYGPGGAVVGRGVGGALGRQSWIPPTKAYGMTRFAEGLEGKGIDPFWQAAGAAGRATQRIPASALVAGSVATDEEDPATNWLWATIDRLMKQKGN